VADRRFSRVERPRLSRDSGENRGRSTFYCILLVPPHSSHRSVREPNPIRCRPEPRHAGQERGTSATSSSRSSSSPRPSFPPGGSARSAPGTDFRGAGTTTFLVWASMISPFGPSISPRSLAGFCPAGRGAGSRRRGKRSARGDGCATVPADSARIHLIVSGVGSSHHEGGAL
jgi:hypothetical protein